MTAGFVLHSWKNKGTEHPWAHNR